MECRLSGLECRVQEFGLVIRKGVEETVEVQAFVLGLMQLHSWCSDCGSWMVAFCGTDGLQFMVQLAGAKGVL